MLLNSCKGDQQSMTFREIDRGDGLIEVEIGEGKLTCTVCGNQQFHERNSLLNTRAATFFNFDWANKEATNYICAQCGYIFWFMEGLS
jgi:predicted nucleic-acid-binding Zn-ribbon protein